MAKKFPGKETAAEERAEAKAGKMANGGKVKKCADGGRVGSAPNAPVGTHGPGVRSDQSKSMKK